MLVFAVVGKSRKFFAELLPAGSTVGADSTGVMGVTAFCIDNNRNAYQMIGALRNSLKVGRCGTLIGFGYAFTASITQKPTASESRAPAATLTSPIAL